MYRIITGTSKYAYLTQFFLRLVKNRSKMSKIRIWICIKIFRIWNITHKGQNLD